MQTGIGRASGFFFIQRRKTPEHALLHVMIVLLKFFDW